MRRTTLTFVSVTALSGLAFAPLVGSTDGLPRTAAEVRANPDAVAAAYADLEGPAESYGDLVRSVENWPAHAQGTSEAHAESAEALEPVARLDMTDVLADPRFASGAGEAKDIGTFLEFFSPLATDPDTGATYRMDVAVMGFNGIGAVLIDITDPESPERLSVAFCNYQQSDIGIYNLGDDTLEGQRWILGIGGDGGSSDCFSTPLYGHRPVGGPTPLGSGPEVFALFDVTDVRNPVPQRAVTASPNTNIGEAHTIEFDPTRPHAYIATALDPVVTRVDFTDPANPVYLPDVVTEGGPHAVRVSADGARMYSAGSFSQTMTVHDISDPATPRPVAAQSTPRNLYTHEVLPAHDRSFVIVADEGAYDPGYGVVVGGGWCPGTGFWIYDMTVESAPVPLSYTVADADFQTHEGQACAVHYGSLSADNRYYVTAYYGGGVRVFDLADPADPVEIGHATFLDSDVWSAKTYTRPDYVFTTDLNRGFEVFRWTGEGDLAQFEAPAEG